MAELGEAPHTTLRWMLYLCGNVRIERSDGVPVRLPGRRERALLVYLALVPNRKEQRKRLTTLLWGDSADALTLDNLRTCLWSLRKGLGEGSHQLILSDRDTIGLNEDALETDLAHFRDLVAQGRLEEADRLAPAAGGILDGLDLESDPFAEWRRLEEARLTNEAVEALHQFGGAAEASGDMEKAIQVQQSILRLDPFNETALQRLMFLYGASGRRSIALQEYAAFAERLLRELGIGPAPETEEVLRQILEGPGLSPGPAVESSLNGPSRGESAAASVFTTEQSALPAAPEAASPHEMGADKAIDLTGAAGRETVSRRESFANRLLRPSLWVLGAIMGIAIGAFGSLAVVFWRVPELAPAPFGIWVSTLKSGVQSAPPSVAVLPFKGYGDQEAREFAEAISDGISSALSLTSDMTVVSRSSVLPYAEYQGGPAQVAATLGVRYLLEGSVSKFGANVAVRTALVDTETNKQLPIGDFEGHTDDFVALQKKITLEAVTALRVHLTEGEEDRIDAVHGTKNYRAWLLTSQGQKHLRLLSPEANKIARRSYEAALALDPKNPRAIAGIAWTYLFEAQSGHMHDPQALVRKAADLAKEALELDRERGSTYSLIGTIALFSREFDLARATGERAVELDYNDSDATALLALTLTYTGEPLRAVTLTKRAIRLKPYPPRWYYWLLARANRLAGRSHEAIQTLEKHGGDPNGSTLPLVELLLSYAEAGAKEKAVATAGTLLDADPDFSIHQWLSFPAYSDPERAKKDREALKAVGLPDQSDHSATDRRKAGGPDRRSP